MTYKSLTYTYLQHRFINGWSSAFWRPPFKPAKRRLSLGQGTLKEHRTRAVPLPMVPHVYSMRSSRALAEGRVGSSFAIIRWLDTTARSLPC